MCEMICQKYWWLRMLKQIVEWVAACECCQEKKGLCLGKTGLLQPLPVVS
jgi:hypothetical protein